MATEIGVTLTGDNAQFKGMLDNSAAKAEEFAGKLANKVGDKLFGLRDVAHTVATALGLNIENIANNVALFVIGSSKEMQKSWEDIAKQTDEIAKLTEERARARLNANQLLVKDTNELNRLLREGAALELSRKVFAEESRMGWAKSAAEKAQDLENQQKLNDNIIARLRIEKQLEEDRKNILEQQNKVLDEGIKISAENAKLHFEELTNAGKIAKLMAERKQFEDDIKRGGLDRVAIETSENEIMKRTADIAKLRKDTEDQALEAGKENLKLRNQLLTPTERIAQLEKERKMFLDDLKRGGLDRIAIQTNENEILTKTLEIEKLRTDAAKATTGEYNKQFQAIIALRGGSTPGGGLSAPDPAMIEAKKKLVAAQSDSQDPVANPNYARTLYAAQLLVDQLQSGHNAATYNYEAAATAAFGPAKIPKSKDLVEIADSTKSSAAATVALHSTVQAIASIVGVKGSQLSPAQLADTSKGSGLSTRPASFSGK